jgi:hypothetical protein
MLAVFSISNVFSLSALAEDSLVLNATGIPLSNEEQEDSYLTKMDIKFSGFNSICNSSICTVEIPSSNSVWFSAPTGTESHITFYGDFFVRDEGNKDLTPKKKDLVETWHVYEQTDVTNIIENIENNQTIYYFDGTLSFNNNFNNIENEYDMEGFYQLPERILQINGTH